MQLLTGAVHMQPARVKLTAYFDQFLSEEQSYHKHF